MIQYPYIPNSNEAVRKEMLDFIGAKSVDTFTVLTSGLIVSIPNSFTPA